jgi:zinc/manganese transport system substrate-binding protein
MRRVFSPLAAVLLTLTAALTSLAGCATGNPGRPAPAAQPGANPKVAVVAAENFWGSIAAQVGGERVSVHSIISNPNADPHDYEPTPADGRTVANAQYVIANGAGYDPWVGRLLEANPAPSRLVLTVAELVGVKQGGNPHRWYSPRDVHRVIQQITTDYKRIDPAGSTYFDQQRQAFESVGMARYDQLIAGIRAKYAGTAIGASESIVTPLAEELGLKVLTPESFLDAISAGAPPTVADKSTADQQIRTKQIKVFVFNRQNATPDVMALVTQAKMVGIPVTTVTETPVPATASFQDWQVGQLVALEQALSSAAAR